MKFEELLKEEINRQYGSVYNLEKTTGINRATVWRIDNNGIDSVSEKTKEALAYYLGLSLDGINHSEIIYDDIPEKPDWIARKEAEKNTPKALPADNAVDPLIYEMSKLAKNLSIKGKFKVIEYIKDISATYSEE